MKKFLLAILTLVFTLCFGASKVNLGSTNTGLTIVKQNKQGLSLTYSLQNINLQSQKANNKNFSQIFAFNHTYTNKIGTPKLPMLRKLIAVPLNAKVTVNISNLKSQTYQLKNLGYENKIIPTQAPVAKCKDALSKIKFEIDNNVYNTDKFTDNKVVNVVFQGYLRGVRLFSIDVTPVSYNPVKNAIRVYNDINFEVNFKGGDYYKTLQLRKKTASAEFNAIYDKFIINNDFYKNQQRSNITKYPTKILMISHSMFENHLDDFVNWKKQQGFDVSLVYTNNPLVGTTNSSIKNYIQNIYNAATPQNPAPSYVIFVGDVNQVPSFSGTQDDADHITDLPYAKLAGGDFLPELMYSRISVTNNNELAAIINKTLMYEKYQMPNPDYLANAVMIAGIDNRFGPTNGNGQINYASNNYFNNDNGINNFKYLYPQSGSSDAAIIQNLSDGVGFANYTAHGDWNEWCNPNLSYNDIDGLQNENKYFFAVGNCCLTNKFDRATCFGEKLTRAENKGAIGYIGATNVTYWNDDYHWAVGSGNVVAAGANYNQTGLGMYDGLFHTHDEDYINNYTSAGSMIICGNLSVLASNGSSNYYWEIYSLMGDPTLKPYLGLPADNTTEVPSTYLVGENQIGFATVPYARVCLSHNAEIIATSMADANGIVVLEANVENPMVADLVITAQNTKPYFGTIEFIPQNTVYIKVNNHTFTPEDAESADIENYVNYNQTTNLNFSLINIGSLDSENLSIDVTSEDTNIQILNNHFDLPAVAANHEAYIPASVKIKISDFAENNHQVKLKVKITDVTNPENTWENDIKFKIAAPKLVYSEFRFVENENPNNIINPGEQVTTFFKVQNTGLLPLTNVSSNIINSNADIFTITPILETQQIINPEETFEFMYQLQVSPDAQTGTAYKLGFATSSNRYDAFESISLSIGLSCEDFESGNFENPNWVQGVKPWNIVTLGGNNNSKCIKSTAINDSETASFEINIETNSENSVSFYNKVSSEENYDFLRFYINNQKVAEWSGNTNWQLFEFNLPIGQVNLKWTYEKDRGDTNGQDCAWIDNITLPGVDTGNIILAGLNKNQISFEKENNEWKTAYFKLYNFSNSPLVANLGNLINFSTNLENSSTTVLANQSTEIAVFFNPSEEILYQENLTVTVNNEVYTLILKGDARVVSTNNNNVNFVTALKGNYPNPFNPITYIKFSLAQKTFVKLDIYNILGQKVKTLKSGKMEKGIHEILWNGKDNKGKNVASGVYFYKLKTNKHIFANKMLLLK